MDTILEKGSMNKTTLYKKAKSGKTQVYTSWTEGPKLFSEFGTLGGKMQETHIVCTGKNIGKSNETSPEEQAIAEGLSKLQLKRDKGYFNTIEESQTEEVFLPMLAYGLDKVKNIEYPLDVQPKLDGVRCMAKDQKLMSRGGKPWIVPHISDTLKEMIPNAVLDGELYIHGKPLQDIVSLVKKYKEGSEEIEYWVYDLYFPQAADMEWSRRKNYLNMVAQMYPDSPIKVVASYRASNEEEMKVLHNKFVSNGYEGAILRPYNGLYELGHRSRTLVKYKEFEDDEFLITGYKEGVGKFVGCVIWECETANGALFHVTPKGTLEMKKEWFKNANDIVGKYLTVRYQAFTNDGIPQFPVGIAIRDYEN